MYYNKRDKMIMMPLFAYNIYYVVILLSNFETYLNLGDMWTYLKIAIESPKVSCEGQIDRYCVSQSDVKVRINRLPL